MKSLKKFIAESKQDTNYITEIVLENNDADLKDFFWKECNMSQDEYFTSSGDVLPCYRMRSKDKYKSVIKKIVDYLPNGHYSFKMFITCDDATYKKLTNIINKRCLAVTDDAEQYDFRNHINYECLDFREYNKEIMQEIIDCLD